MENTKCAFFDFALFWKECNVFAFALAWLMFPFFAFALWLLCAYFEEPNNEQEYSMVNFTKSTRS
jgi:hypothetical protein